MEYYFALQKEDIDELIKYKSFESICIKLFCWISKEPLVVLKKGRPGIVEAKLTLFPNVNVFQGERITVDSYKVLEDLKLDVFEAKEFAMIRNGYSVIKQITILDRIWVNTLAMSPIDTNDYLQEDNTLDVLLKKLQFDAKIEHSMEVDCKPLLQQSIEEILEDCTLQNTCWVYSGKLKPDAIITCLFKLIFNGVRWRKSAAVVHFDNADSACIRPSHFEIGPNKKFIFSQVLQQF